jgi:predicted house-cleaning noncanonical NTP pyrophosphatase (MazG superfamily)
MKSIDFKNLAIIVENMNKTLVYHVTSRRYLTSIVKNGIQPKIPEDYGDGGDEMGIYCFPSMEDVENALMNWLGERIEEWEEDNDKEYLEIVLVLDITGLKIKKNHDVGYEILVKEPISPNRIVEMIEV